MTVIICVRYSTITWGFWYCGVVFVRKRDLCQKLLISLTKHYTVEPKGYSRSSVCDCGLKWRDANTSYSWAWWEGELPCWYEVRTTQRILSSIWVSWTFLRSMFLSNQGPKYNHSNTTENIDSVCKFMYIHDMTGTVMCILNYIAIWSTFSSRYQDVRACVCV